MAKAAKKTKKTKTSGQKRYAAMLRRRKIAKMAGVTLRKVPSGAKHGNFGKPKSSAHKEAISKAMKVYWRGHRPKRNPGGKCDSPGCPLPSLKSTRAYKRHVTRMNRRPAPIMRNTRRSAPARRRAA